ncbi:MAG: CpsD/CapB family tyrosine-protein kinase [Candidatus Sulfotelmatobacter sp.]
MSKNFELIQAQQPALAEGVAAVSERTPLLFPSLEAVSTPQAASQKLDQMAQEECLKLVQRIFLAQPANGGRAIVFAGVDRRNGCSGICVEAARSLAANTSRSICVVDANFRSSSLNRLLAVPDERGLADCMLEEGAVRTFTRQLEPSHLHLLPAGFLTPESPNLLNSERLASRLGELRKEFDYILIDAPALNVYSDALALGRAADGVVVVLEADSTRRESALKGVESLREVQIEVLGAVLNRRTFPIPEFLYRRL